MLLLGCGGGSSPAAAPTPPPPTPTLQSTIQHVVIIVQENRSFDDMFSGFPGADAATTGMNNGQVVTLSPVPLENPTDLDHTHKGWWKDWDGGKNDNFGWKANYPSTNFPYAYVPRDESQPYWTLASAYTLADRMFQSNTGPSFVAHQYIIAGQSNEADNNPNSTNNAWGCDSPTGTTVTLIGPNGTDLPGPFPCFDYQTMGDLLDASKVSWKYYAPSAISGDGGYIWSAFDAIKHIRFGPDWAGDVISPETQVLTDIKSGNLAQVSWVVPSWANSDHPSTKSNTGPDWVASIVNEIGASAYWSNTVVFITWDDWGGWYDHVPPPQIDNMGLGFRVPLIVVSPYAKQAYISHQQHEFGSFLAFLELRYSLPSLKTRDAVSDNLMDCFDFSQTVQPYTPVPTTLTPDDFVHEINTGPPDDD